MYALTYDICFPLSDLLHSTWQTLGPSISPSHDPVLLSFFFMAEQYSIVYMNHIFFIHSPVDGHIGCFHVLGYTCIHIADSLHCVAETNIVKQCCKAIVKEHCKATVHNEKHFSNKFFKKEKRNYKSTRAFQIVSNRLSWGRSWFC